MRMKIKISKHIPSLKKCISCPRAYSSHLLCSSSQFVSLHRNCMKPTSASEKMFSSKRIVKHSNTEFAAIKDFIVLVFSEATKQTI